MKYVTGMYAGFLTSNKISYSSIYPKTNETSLDNYNYLYNTESISCIDTEHLINCLVYGSSVEVHSFDGDSIKISSSNPLNWVPIWDEKDQLQAAIYKCKLPAYSYFNGELLTAEKTIYYFYDSELVVLYQEVKTQDGPGLQMVDIFDNPYGRVPVVFGITTAPISICTVQCRFFIH